MRRLVLCCMLLLMFGLLAQPGLAKGPPEMVTLTGPGVSGEFRWTYAAGIVNLGMATLEDVMEGEVDAPVNPGEGYQLTRYYQDRSGRYIPFDSVRYYPRDGRDLVYYEGIINGSGPYDRKWYYATPEGEAAFADFLLQARVITRMRRLREAAL